MMLRADQFGRMTALPEAANDDRVHDDRSVVGPRRARRADGQARRPARPSGEAGRAFRSAPAAPCAIESATAGGWFVYGTFPWTCAPLGAAPVTRTQVRICEAALVWGELGLLSAAGLARLAASGLELAKATVGGLFSFVLAPLRESARDEPYPLTLPHARA